MKYVYLFEYESKVHKQTIIFESKEDARKYADSKFPVEYKSMGNNYDEIWLNIDHTERCSVRSIRILAKGEPI